MQRNAQQNPSSTHRPSTALGASALLLLEKIVIPTVVPSRVSRKDGGGVKKKKGRLGQGVVIGLRFSPADASKEQRGGELVAAAIDVGLAGAPRNASTR